MDIATVLPMTATAAPDLAAAGNIGFKDWGIICAALGTGRQSLILRKGGIAEGRQGFRFKHESFFLFPTGFHQQFEKVRTNEPDSPETRVIAGADTVSVQWLFALDFAHWVDDWEVIMRLEPFHIWKEELIRERFEYGDQQGLQCAYGRVFRCNVPWTFPNRAAYGGCRSWVTLPEPPMDLRLVPVLDEQAHHNRRRAAENIVLPV